MEFPLRTQSEEKSNFIRVFFITFFVALSIRIFIAQPFIVNGASMEPHFSSGEYLIVDEVSYRFRTPERGEVVVFKFPGNTSKFYIKRIVGLPGETIKIENNVITIKHKDGKEEILHETYISDPTTGSLSSELSDDEYFVLGDNRLVSSDSRKWGPVQSDLIIGRALIRFLPITHFDILPGIFPAKP